MTEIESKWLRIDTLSNAIDYLEQAIRFIKETDKNDIAWKWAIISLYGALYSFAICACKGTDGTSVTYLTKKGDRMLIGFNEALRRCQDDDYMRHIYNSNPLVISEQIEKSVNLLKDEYRNNFEHFQPMGWSIELHNLPIMAIDIFDVIKYLALETGYSRVHMSEDLRQKTAISIDEIIQFLKETDLFIEINTK
jgi:hypothetical protein